MKFYKALKAKPEIIREKTDKASEQRDLLNAFVKSSDMYAELLPVIVGKYKSSSTCARGIGRIIKTLKLSVRVFSDKEKGKVYLEKVVVEPVEATEETTED